MRDRMRLLLDGRPLASYFPGNGMPIPFERRPAIPSTLAIPRQARSQKALERFLEAGEALVADNAFEAAGVAEIAKRADSSVGTFYRLIGDKDTLLRAVHDRFVEYARARIATTLDPAKFVGEDLETVLTAFVQLMVDLYAEREGMIRALIVRSSADPSFRERISALRNDIRMSIGGLVLPRAHEIKHPNPLEAFAFGVKVIVGVLNHATVVNSMEGEASATMVRELTRILVRYLEVK